MISKILEKTKKIETLLTNNYGAEGRGLHDKASSVEKELAPDIMKKIRWIATIRNKSVHEDGFTIKDSNTFLNNCNDVITYLEKNSPNSLNSDTNQSNLFDDNTVQRDYNWEKKSWWSKLNTPIKLSLCLIGALGIGAVLFFYWAKILAVLILGAIFVYKFIK